MSTMYGPLLKSRGFTRYLAALFLGAFNDNAFKMVVSLVAVGLAAGPEGAGGGGGAGGAGYVSLVGAVFIAPFILFSGYAGHFADVASKRTVLVAMKFFEVAATGAALFSLIQGDFLLMLAALFLLAAQSAFLSPAKYGILPEMLPHGELSRANGLLEMSTFAAIILGTAAGSVLFAAWGKALAPVGAFLVIVAAAGAGLSLAIPKVAASSGASRGLGLNPWGEILRGLGTLRRDRLLGLTSAGVAWFWFLGALLQMEILLHGKEVMGLTDLRVGLLVTVLAFGIGAGSLAAGRLSGDKIEPGLVPIGAVGIGAFSVALSLLGSSYAWSSLAVAALGFSGGLFIVPLKALLQRKSAAGEKGRVIATSNLLNTLGILAASAVLWLGGRLSIGPDTVILAAGIASAGASVLAARLLPAFLTRFVFWCLTHARYRIRVEGGENIPARGPALLVSNHLSFADPFFVGASVQRFVRFMVERDFYEMRLIGRVMRVLGAIPVRADNPRDVLGAIRKARGELETGHVVCIFAEGMISRTGGVLGFKKGLERVVKGLDAPVIPVHLDGVWGSVFSFKHGKFFWKRPERLVRSITVSFGRPLRPGATSEEVRAKVTELAARAVGLRLGPRETLHGRFIRTARRHPARFCMADSTGASLSYGRALAASLALSKRFAGLLEGERAVAVMLPASVGGALANIALLVAGKTPVNLNFTAGQGQMRKAVERCGATSLVTSRAFTEKAGLGASIDGLAAGGAGAAGVRTLYVEDLSEGIGRWEKALAALASRLAPARAISALYPAPPKGPESLATVVFTSGSTTEPKGVMLTHRNILANIEGFAQVFHVSGTDVMLAPLPFFHAFGLTASIWFPLLSGCGAVYHANPMDARTIGRLARDHGATILLATPTFCSAYTKSCDPRDFSTLRLAIAGAEKLTGSVARAFHARFGVEVLEGYGATEMSPVISVNTPDVVHKGLTQRGARPGTVGRPIPGVATMVIDPGSGDILPAGAEGLLLVRGPNMMAGYLDDEPATVEAVRDGWYVTGDIASVSPDGFITVTDRVARFSKIAGEMVPHAKVEEALTGVLGGAPSAVVASPGLSRGERGERILAFYQRCGVGPAEALKRLRATELPRLWIPKRGNIFEVDEIPVAATGKTDMGRLRQMALDLTTGSGRGK
ncbi:MAG: MFS transporter [Thermodesulfobacteriota bacterium]